MASCGVQGARLLHGEELTDGQRIEVLTIRKPYRMDQTTLHADKNAKTVETLKHDEAKRKNIPTAEYQSVMQKEEQDPIRVAYERRNRDLDPAARLARQG